jgi:ligand-binding SRPBCC domain-containing protein
MHFSSFEQSVDIAAPAAALRAWHFQDGAFERLNPPWEKARVIESPGALVDGARAVIEVNLGPLRRRWVAEHEITEDGFIDRQVEGPFALWEHHHRFLPVDENSSRLVDSIRYRLPLGWLGRIFGDRFVRARLERMFRYRHEVTRAALEAGDKPGEGASA